jgi:hypothetical protein
MGYILEEHFVTLWGVDTNHFEGAELLRWLGDGWFSVE